MFYRFFVDLLFLYYILSWYFHIPVFFISRVARLTFRSLCASLFTQKSLSASLCTPRGLDVIVYFHISARSPVFSHLSATLQGLHTIRAFSVEEKFVEEFDAHQDLHSESFFLFLASSRWLAVRIDWICVLFITAVSFLCVIAADCKNSLLFFFVFFPHVKSAFS